MDTATEVGAHMNSLHESVWELAAIVIGLRDERETDPALRQAAEDVLVETGLMVRSSDGSQPCTGLSEVAHGDLAKVAAQASAGILQSAAVASGARAWTAQDDAALVAQGRSSAQAAQPFKMFALPAMPGLGELMSAPAAAMLDVGVGIAAMAVAYCQAFPELRVVGIDVFPRALELARTTVDEAGMAGRIELRHQDVAQLDDVEQFCLGWLPAPFVPGAALEKGLPRMVAALVPGGWLMVGHGKLDVRGRSSALTRFQTIAFGGTALDNDEAQELLRGVGLDLVATLPTPEGAPAITVGRRPGLA